MKFILGPMEGVLDGPMRTLLSQINPLSYCVTEFIRVVDQKLPKRTFYKLCPELEHEGKTINGTPVRIQLLGHSPLHMAENAELAASLGSFGIDINFGCPSKTVNGNKAGAALLKEPELMYQIVHAVRSAVPSTQKVSAKIRLGFDDCSSYSEIVDAVVQAGANELVVHGRSKADGYAKETIRWDLIGKIKQQNDIDIIANGEIWCAQDAINCANITHCDTLMLCRGALTMPNLAAHILFGERPYCWQQVLALLIDYAKFEIKGDEGLYYANRIKQWLRYLQLGYPEAKSVFFELRSLTNKQSILSVLKKYADNTAASNADMAAIFG